VASVLPGLRPRPAGRARARRPGPGPHDRRGPRRPHDAGSRGLAHLPLPRHRAPRRRARPAGHEAPVPRSAPARVVRPERGGPRHAVRPRAHAAARGLAAPRRRGRPPRHVLPPHRRGVHAHPGPREAPVAPVVDGVGGEPAAVRRRGEGPDPPPAHRGRGVRGVPRQALQGHEAVRARRGRVAHPHAPRDRGDGPARRRPRAHDRHGPPRPPERARERAAQDLRPDLHRVRGGVDPGLPRERRRREVPPRVQLRLRDRLRGVRAAHAVAEPLPPRVRQLGGARAGPGQAAAAPGHGPPPRSPGRASWPSAST
jgi:hypothetical protein